MASTLSSFLLFLINIESVNILFTDFHKHFLIAGLVLVGGRRRRGTVERDLFEDLTMNYDAGTRPVLHANKPVNVNFSISLHQIMDLVRLFTFTLVNTYYLKLLKHVHWRIQGGAPGTRAPPLGVQILSFSCSFRQKCEK